MKKPLFLNAPISLKAAAGKPRRFSILAYSGGKLPVDGFPVPVVVDLAGLEASGSVPIILDHEATTANTLGGTDSIVNDGRSLILSGPVTGTSQQVRQVIEQADGGQQWQASIGAMVLEAIEIAAGESVAVNGQQFTGPVIVARRAVLRETSVLPMGADATTSVNLAARAARLLKGSAVPTFEEWAASKGFDVATLTPDQLAVITMAYEAEQTAPVEAAPATPAPAPVAPAPAAVVAAGAKPMDIAAHLNRMNEETSANLMRHNTIMVKASGHPMIAAKAIKENWSVDKVELEVMKANQIQATGARVTSFKTGNNAIASEQMPLVLEAALCVSRGQKSVEKDFKPEILEAAHALYRGRIGIQQVLLQAAAENGMHVAPGERINTGNLREVMRASCMVRAGHFSTASTPGILSNVANKELRNGFEEEENVWREIAAIKSVSDFKTVTSYRLLDNMEYEQLGATGHIAHGAIGEESYTRSAKTYAKMFALTREMIINDDLGAFDDIRTRLGRGAARKLNRVVWTTFLSNAGTFWTTARTNYIEGATTNLGLDGVGLGLGVTAFRKRTSPLITGQPETSRMRLGGSPTKLLVPPELEHIANTLYAASNINAVKASDANIHVNKYRPIVAPELSDSSFSGYSATAWYLFNDMMAPVDVSFLNGQQTPTIDSADADFDQLGIQFRGYHDFGADQSEYLAGVKSKGAS